MFELWRGWLDHARVTDVASDEESGALPLLTERDALNSQRKKSTQLSQKMMHSTLRRRNQLNSQLITERKKINSNPSCLMKEINSNLKFSLKETNLILFMLERAQLILIAHI